MSNPYFTKSGYPATSARAVSASLRAEIANIEAGFDKLPTLSGNGGKAVVVNSGGTALVASKVTITEPATSATLTIADGKTLTVSENTTLTGGAFTFTASNLVNITSVTFALGQYSRNGSIVTCSGLAQIIATTAAAFSFSMTIPVNSTFVVNGTWSPDCAGWTSQGGNVQSEIPPVANSCIVTGTAPYSGSALPVFFHFTYIIK